MYVTNTKDREHYLPLITQLDEKVGAALKEKEFMQDYAKQLEKARQTREQAEKDLSAAQRNYDAAVREVTAVHDMIEALSS